MINTNLSDFKNNIDDFIEQAIKYNQPININTKSGNAVLISEDDYNNLNATLELSKNHYMQKKL